MQETTSGGGSPRALARTIGALYLATVVLGGLAQGLIADRMISLSDAAGTAANVLADERLYRLGFTLYLLEMACQVGMTALLYDLLRPAGRRAAILATSFGLVGCVVKTVGRVFYFAPLLILSGAHPIRDFGAGGAEGLALLLLRLNHQSEVIAVVFFGLHSVISGHLIIRSGYLPRALGALSLLGGLGWLTYLWPPLGDSLVGLILPVAILGALALIGWLLVVGVDEVRWRARAASPAS
ncbi:MAG: hypothetical protein AMXMBFR53_08480 [Gemmatimonadota bacterium]